MLAAHPWTGWGRGTCDVQHMGMMYPRAGTWLVCVQQGCACGVHVVWCGMVWYGVGVETPWVTGLLCRVACPEGEVCVCHSVCGLVTDVVLAVAACRHHT